MNKIYKVIWSKARNCYVVVSEIAKSHSKGGTGVSGVVKKAGSSALLTAAVTAMLLSPMGSAWAEDAKTEYNPATNSVAVGSEDVTATGGNGTAVGVNHTVAAGTSSVAVGDDAKAIGDGSVAIGDSATASENNAVAIGNGASAHQKSDTAVGEGATTVIKDPTTGEIIGGGGEAAAYGHNSSATGAQSVAVGNQATSSGSESVAIGDLSQATGGDAVAVGEEAYASGGDSTAVGADSQALTGSDSAFGHGAIANGKGEGNEQGEATAIGNNATAQDTRATAVGADADAMAEDSTALGSNALAEGERSVALGGADGQEEAAHASGKYSSAIGTGTEATGVSSTAVGGGPQNNGAQALEDGAIAIGGGGEDTLGANASGVNSTAVGVNTSASGEQAVAIGSGAKNDPGASAVADKSIVIGAGAKSDEAATNGVAIGTGSSVTVENGVALGAGSIANVGAAEEPGFIPNPKTYIKYVDNPIWQSNEAAVSIGNPDGSVTRQITGVAAGTNDWDAANVAQLKAAMTHYYSVNTTKETDEEGNNNYANDGATGNNALAAGVHTTASGNNATAMGPYAAADGTASIAIGSAKVDATGALTTKQVPILDDEGNPVLDEEGNPTYKTVAVTDTNPQATGLNGIAVGTNAKSWSDNAIAMGTDSATWGENGTAVGTQTQASTNASAYGYQAKAHGEDSTAIGYTTYVSGKDSTAVGSHATSQGPNSTSVGLYATTNGADQTAVGEGAVVDDGAQYGTAVGYKANAKSTSATAVAGIANGYESTAVGKTTTAGGSYSTAVGNNNTAGGSYATAVGYKANGYSTESTAVGYQAQGNGYQGTAVGWSSNAGNSQSTAVGYYAQGTGSQATAVGYSADANNSQSTAVGYYAQGNGYAGTAVGYYSHAGSSSSTAVGYSAQGNGMNSTAAGYGAVATASDSTALGFKSTANGNESSAVGGGVSAGQYSTAVGYTTNAGGTNSTAVGNYNTAGGSYATAVGYRANGYSSESTAVGYQAQGNGSQGTAVGWSANAGNSQSTAVGYYAQGTGYQSTAVGYSADANYSQSTAVGYYAQGNGYQGTAVGYYSHAGSSNSTAVGYQAQGNGTNSTATGYGAVADGTNSTSIGNTSNAHGQQSTAIGGGVAGYSSQYGVAIGQTAGAGSTNSTAIGAGAQSPATNATAVGYNADAKYEAATAVGKQAQAQNTNSTAVGNVANAGGYESTAVGNYAQATYNNATAVGNSAKGNNYNATGVGYNANAGGSNSAAVGYLASAWGTNGAAVGYNSGAGENAAAVGYGANAYGTNAAALGYGASAGANAVAAGVSANAWGTNGIALGTSSNAGNDAVVLGRSAVGWKDDTIVLGKESVSGEDKQQGTENHGYDPLEGVGDPVDYTTPTWQSTNNAVSFGRAEEKKYDPETGELIETIPAITRQINNVAAGTLDTDVVNVAQLKRAIGEATAGSGIHYYGADDAENAVKDDASNITTDNNITRIHNQQLNVIGDSEYSTETVPGRISGGKTYTEKDGKWIDVNGNELPEDAEFKETEVTRAELTKEGNILTSATEDKYGIKAIQVRLNDTIELGGPGKDGADGKDGFVGVNGADGKSGVGIDGKDGITVYGKDGKDGEPAVAINGKDGVGTIGLAGRDGTNGKDGTSRVDIQTGPGTPGLDGKDGTTRIIYEDGDGEHEVATLDDGMRYAGDDGLSDAGAEVASQIIPRKLNQRLDVIGDTTYDFKFETKYIGDDGVEYSKNADDEWVDAEGNVKPDDVQLKEEKTLLSADKVKEGNILTSKGMAKDGSDAIKIELNNNLEIGGPSGIDGVDGVDGHVGVNGADGKDGVGIDGKDGSITIKHEGLNGKDGTDGVSMTVKNGVDGEDGTKGAAGVDGKDGITRIVYEDNTGEHQVATMDDGLRFAGDDGLNADGSETDKVIPKKLNNRLDIVGDTKYEITTTSTDTVKHMYDGVEYTQDTETGKWVDAAGNELAEGLEPEEVTVTTTSTNAEKIKDGNILTSKGTAQDGSDAIKIELNKDVDLGPDGSLKVGGTVNEEGDIINPPITIANQTVVNQAGDEETGNYITNLDNRTWDPNNIVEGRAATEDQLAAVQTHYYSVNDNGTQQDNWYNDGATGVNALAAGTNAKAAAEQSVAVGDHANVISDNAINGVAIGHNATATAANGIALGSYSMADRMAATESGYDVTTGTNYDRDDKDSATWKATAGALSIGGTSEYRIEVPKGTPNAVEGEDGKYYMVIQQETTRQITGVAAGLEDTDAVNVAQLKRLENAMQIHDYSVNSIDPGSDLNYDNKGATGDNALAAGVSAIAMGNNGTAVGNRAEARGENSTAVGNGAIARNENSVAVGNLALAAEKGAVALGDNAKADHADSVALGSNAQTAEKVGTATFTTKNGKVLNFAGTEPVGTVSVGTEGNERTITNVAAGRISETSTDAINGSQLYAALDAMSDEHTTVSVGGVKATADGVPVEGGNLAMERTQDPDTGAYNYDLKLAKEIDVDAVVVNGKDGEPGKIGLRGEPGADGTPGEISYISVTKDGVPGVDGKDGVTRIIIDDKPVATLDDGLKYTGDFGDGAAVKLNKTVNVVGNAKNEDDLVDGNIGVTADQDGEDGKLTIKLNKDIDLGDEGSITFGDVHIHDGDEISFGDNVIHNVAPGVEDNDVVNVSQLKQYSAAARTEVSVGDVRVTEDGTPVTGGNLELKRTKDENDEHDIYDVRLAKDIDVDTIVVNGKDGKDGKIGINGEDGVTSYITVTHDGVPGVDGKDGITRIIIDDKPVATLDDGLKFGANAPEANSGNPVANKLNSTVNIKAADAVEGHTYSTKNLTTTVDQDEDGNTTILVKMDNDLETDTIVVNGKDGKDGRIGINGKDGVTSYITVTHDGEPGVDGKDGITRIIIDDKPVATLDDGLKYTGDFGDGAAVKLNKTVNVVGNAKNEDNLVDGNIGVTADQDREDGKLTIKLNKDINLGDEGSITFGDVHIHDGDEISFGDKVIHNVAPGVEDNDVVNVSQLKQYSAAAKTEVSVGDVRVAEDGTPVTGGNLELKRTKDENDEHEIYDVRLAKDIDVDTIVVNGKDGKDGAVGLTGKDGVTRTITITKDGAPGLDGKDGEVRIVYEDGEHNTHEVATLDDGLKFGANAPEANSGNPVANKLNSTINILGEEPAEGAVYSTKNLTTTVDQDEDGNTTILVKMNRDLDVDTIVVNGKDGKDGKIGINGEDGQTTTISVQTDGKPGLDGEDGITRIVYKDPEGNDHDVATLDDGLKYAGDFGNGAAVKLNNTVNIKGEAKNEDDLTTGNIGVVANQNPNEKDADLIIKLNKDINLGDTGSITMGDVYIHDGDKISFGDNQIHNVAAGTEDTDVVNVSQLKEYSAAAKTEVTVGGGVKAGTDGNYNTGGNLDLNVSTADDGHEVYDLKLADNVELGGPGKDGKDGVNGSIGVNGADGKSGVGIDGENGITVYGKDGKDGEPAVAINGKDGVGHIGLTGPAGADGKNASADITVQQGPVGVDGTDGADGTDGMDRIVYEDHNGTTHEVATLDDGMKYSGDFGNTKDNPVPVKLNNIVDIVGESTAASEDELSDGNIGVVAKADGDGAKLVVKLNKNIDLTEEGSVTMGDTVINNEGMTINEGPSFTKNKIDVAGNKIINVAPGEDGTDAVNVDQLKEYSGKAKTEVTVGGGVKAGTDGNYNTGGNLDLNVSTAEDGHEVYDLKLADQVELGGPGKDGKDGVDGSIGVNGADGKSGVGIDGKDGITVYGKDGKDGDPAVSIRGEDGVGHIGLAGPAGKDGADGISDIHMIWGDPTVGNDGDPGKDGITRIEYTDPEGNPHQVATMDDGLYFGANSGDPNPAANKLTSTVEIKGAGEKDDENYSGENLKTIISQTGEGAEAVTTINVVMDKDLNVDNIAVNGKDGKDGTIGINGRDGTNGKDGTNRVDIQVGPSGEPGLDGKDGVTRIIYEDGDGEHEVATLDDGMKYAGDFGDGAAVKLNKTVNVIGEAKNEDDLTTGNIGVVAEQDGDDGKLTVKLNKDIDLGKEGSVTTGDTVINDNGLTINEGPSVTKEGIDAGGNKIINVAPGEADTDAVNVSQLRDFEDRIGGDITNINNNLNKLGDRVNKVGAGAAALAGLHPLDFDPDAKWDVAAGYGHYNGENAVAIGAFYRPSEDVMVNVASTVGNGDNMISAGVAVKLGGANHVSNSRVALAKQVLEMRKEMEDMKSLMADSAFGRQLDLSKIQLFPDTPENHWAYDYVATLAGNGLLEGYPDGNFRGDRDLTRYEVAAILYRAMMNGAQLTQRALEEFAPELDRIRVDTLTRHSDGTPSIQRVRIIKDRR